MSADVLKFPRSKKRGRKVTRGPAASVSVAYEVAPAQPPEIDSLAQQISEHLRAASSKRRLGEEDCFRRWREGVQPSAKDFIASSRWGIATDTFGEGPAMFRWAIESTRAADILKPSQKDEALNIALELLNKISLQVRVGGGFSGSSDDDFHSFLAADLGRALRRLACFGAVSRPTGEEREILAQSKAKFDGRVSA